MAFGKGSFFSGSCGKIITSQDEIKR